MQTANSIEALRTCLICKVPKPRSEFHAYRYTTNQGERSTRLEGRCKPCNVIRRNEMSPARKEHANATARDYKATRRDALNRQVREYRAANRDKVLAMRREHEAKRRAKGYNPSAKASYRPISEALELARFGAQYLDAYTGELIDFPTIDHVEPLSLGGEHIFENLCITSGANNRSKHNTPLLIWMLRRRKKAESIAA